MSGAAAQGARAITPVAVGVLVRSDGAVLLADRPAGKPYAAHWEFPGGKIEPGESVARALARELREELGLQAGRSVPWIVMEHVYPHAHVRLHFRRVFDWSGTLHPLEGQRLCFLPPGQDAPAPLLPAAVPALRWIRLPAVSLFSPGTARTARQAQEWLEAALARGARLIVWHEPALDETQLAQAVPACRARARDFGAQLLVDARSARRAGGAVDDVFLCAAQLRAASARPASGWIGAQVWTRADLRRAAQLGCDFAVAGEPPAVAGGDGPQNPPAGARRDYPLPVYLARSLSAAALDAALRRGAHGLAQRGLPGEGQG